MRALLYFDWEEKKLLGTHTCTRFELALDWVAERVEVGRWLSTYLLEEDREFKRCLTRDLTTLRASL